MKLNAYKLLGALLACVVLVTGCQTTHRISSRLSERELPYSFSKPPYIHPKIIEDLTTWESDTGDQIIEINLVDAQDSNRYSDNVLVKELGNGLSPFVYVEERHAKNEAPPYFGYRYIGTTTSGIHVLRTALDGGGSGTFVTLVFLSIHREKGASFVQDNGPRPPSIDRVVLHKEGEVVLGDRWEGDLSVRGNTVLIGKDRGWFSRVDSGSMTTNGEHTLSILDESQHKKKARGVVSGHRVALKKSEANSYSTP
jgi:hypothetical protein